MLHRLGTGGLPPAEMMAGLLGWDVGHTWWVLLRRQDGKQQGSHLGDLIPAKDIGKQ